MNKNLTKKRITNTFALCLGLCFLIIFIFGALSSILIAGSDVALENKSSSVETVAEGDFTSILGTNTGENKELRLNTYTAKTSTTLGAVELNGSLRTYYMTAGDVMNDVIVANENEYFWNPMPSADIVGFFGQYSAGREQRFKFYSRIPGKTEGTLYYAVPNNGDVDNSALKWYSIKFVFVVRVNKNAYDPLRSPMNKGTIASRTVNLTEPKYEFNVNDIAELPETVGTGTLGIIAASVRYPGAVDATAYATYDIGISCNLTAQTGIGLNYFTELGIDSRNLYYLPFGIEFLVKNFRQGEGTVGIITCYFNTYAPVSQYVARPVEMRSIDPINKRAYGTAGPNAASFRPYTTEIYEPQPDGSTLEYYDTKIGGPNETGRNNYYHEVRNDTAPTSTTAKDGMGAEYYAKGTDAIGFDVVLHHTQNYLNTVFTGERFGCAQHGAESPSTDQTISQNTYHIPPTIQCTGTGKLQGGAYVVCSHNYLHVFSSNNSNTFTHVFSPESDKVDCMADRTYAGLNAYRYCAHGFYIMSEVNGRVRHYNPSYAGCYYDDVLPAVYVETMHNYNTVPFYFASNSIRDNYPISATAELSGLKTLTIDGNNAKELYLKDLGTGKDFISHIKQLRNDIDDNNYSEIENIYAYDSSYFSASLIKNKGKSYVKLIGMANTTASNPKYLVLTVRNVIGGVSYRRLFSVKINVTGDIPQNQPLAYEQPNKAPTALETEHAIALRTFERPREASGQPFFAGKDHQNSIAQDNDSEAFGFYENAGALLYDDDAGASQARANNTFFVNKISDLQVELVPKGLTNGLESFYLKVTDIDGADGFIEISANIYNIKPVFTATERITIAPSPATATPGGANASTFTLTVNSPSGTSESNVLYNFATDADEYPTSSNQSTLTKDVLTIEFYNWTEENENHLARANGSDTVAGRAGAKSLKLTAKKRGVGITLQFRVFDGYDYEYKTLIVDITNSGVEKRASFNPQFMTLDAQDNKPVQAGDTISFTGAQLGVDFDRDEIYVADVRCTGSNGQENYIIKYDEQRTGGYLRAEVNQGIIKLTAVARSTKHTGYTGQGDFAIEIQILDIGTTDTIGGGAWITVPIKITTTAPEAVEGLSVEGASGFERVFTPEELAYDIDSTAPMDFTVPHSASLNADPRYADDLKFNSIVLTYLEDFAEIEYLIIDNDAGTETKTASITSANAIRVRLLRYTGNTVLSGQTENPIRFTVSIADLDSNAPCTTRVEINVLNTASVYRYTTDQDGKDKQYRLSNTEAGRIPLGTENNPICYEMALNNPDVPMSEVVIGPYDYIDDIDLQKAFSVGLDENKIGEPNVDAVTRQPNGFNAKYDALSFSLGTVNERNNSMGYVSVVSNDSSRLIITASLRNYGEQNIRISVELHDSRGTAIMLYFQIMVYNSPPRANPDYLPSPNALVKDTVTLLVNPEFDYEIIHDTNVIIGYETVGYNEDGTPILDNNKPIYAVKEIKETLKADSFPKIALLDSRHVFDDDDVDAGGENLDHPKFLNEFVLVKDNTIPIETSNNAVKNPGDYLQTSLVDHGVYNELQIEALKSTRFIRDALGNAPFVWLGVYATDGTADSYSYGEDTSLTYHKSKAVWIKLNIKNSNIVQPEYTTYTQNFDKSIAVGTEFQIMIRANDSGVSKNIAGNRTAFHPNPPSDPTDPPIIFEEHNSSYPLFIIADDFDSESIYLRSANDSNNYDGINGPRDSKNGNSIQTATLSYYFKNQDGGWQSAVSAEAICNKFEWFILVTFRAQSSGIIDFYLSDTPTTDTSYHALGYNESTGAKISKFTLRYKIASLALLEAYKGMTLINDLDDGNADNDVIEFRQETYDKANPKISKQPPHSMGAYRVNIWDLLRTRIDKSPDSVPSGSFVRMVKNDQEYNNENAPFYEIDPTDNRYLKSTKSSIRIRQGDQKYISILGGSSNGLRQNIEGGVLSYINILPLQRTPEPIEVQISVNIVTKWDANEANREYAADEDATDGRLVITFSIYVSVINAPVLDSSTPITSNSLVYVNNTTEADVLVDPSRIKDVNDTLSPNNNAEVSNTNQGLNAIQNSFRRTGITGITSAHTSASISTFTPISLTDEQKHADLIDKKQLRLPINDDDVGDSHYILLDSIDKSFKMNESSGAVGEQLIDFENRRTDSNPSGLSYALPVFSTGVQPTYNNMAYKATPTSDAKAYTDYFELTIDQASQSPTLSSGQIDKAGTQTLYIKPKKQTKDLPGGYFPLYFMVYDDYLNSSKGMGALGMPITSDDILRGINSKNTTTYKTENNISESVSNIDGVVSRQIFCVFVYIVNSLPKAKKDTVRFTLSPSSSAEKLDFTSLVSDADIATIQGTGGGSAKFEADKTKDYFSYVEITATAEDNSQNGTFNFDAFLDIKKGLYQPDTYTTTEGGVVVDNVNGVNGIDTGIEKQTIQIKAKARYGHSTRLDTLGVGLTSPYPLRNNNNGKNERIKVFRVRFYDSSAVLDGFAVAQQRRAYAEIKFEVYITNDPPIKTVFTPEVGTPTGYDFMLSTLETIKFVLPYTSELPIGTNYKKVGNTIYIRPAIDAFDTPQDKLTFAETSGNPNDFLGKYNEYFTFSDTSGTAINMTAAKPTHESNPITLSLKIVDDEDEFNSVICTYVIGIKATPPEVVANNTGDSKLYAVSLNKPTEIELMETEESDRILTWSSNLNVFKNPISQASGKTPTKFANGTNVLPAFVGQGSFLIDNTNTSANKWIQVESNSSTITVRALNVYDQTVTANPDDYKNTVQFYAVDQFNNACLVTLNFVVVNETITLNNASSDRIPKPLDVVGRTTQLSMDEFVIDNPAEFENKSNRYEMTITEVLSSTLRFDVAKYDVNGNYTYYGRERVEEEAYKNAINDKDNPRSSMYDYFELPAQNGIELGKFINFVSKKRTPAAINIDIKITKYIWKVSGASANREPVTLTLQFAFRVQNSAPIVYQENQPILANDIENRSTFYVAKGQSKTLPLYGSEDNVDYLVYDADGDPIRFTADDVTVVDDDTGRFKDCFELVQDGQNIIITGLKKMIVQGQQQLTHTTKTIRIVVRDSSDATADRALEFPITIDNTPPVSNRTLEEGPFELKVYNGMQFKDYVGEELVDVLPLSYFITDPDIGTTDESFLLTIDSENIATQNGYDIKSTSGEVIANIKAVNGSSQIIITGKSNARGAVSDIITVRFRDSSYTLAYVPMRFTVGNTAPTRIDPIPAISILNDGSNEVSRYVFFNEADHMASGFTNQTAFLPLARDINPDDRFQYSNYASDITVKDREKPLVKIDRNATTGNFGFIFTLLPGAFGVEQLTIRLYDSDPLNLSKEPMSVIVNLQINIAETPSNLVLSSYGGDADTYFYEKHYKTVKPSDVFKQTDKGGSSLAYGYSFVPGTFTFYKPGDALASPVGFSGSGGNSSSGALVYKEGARSNSVKTMAETEEDTGEFSFDPLDPIVEFYNEQYLDGALEPTLVKGNEGTILHAVRAGVTQIRVVLDVVGYKFDLVLTIIVRQNLQPTLRDTILTASRSQNIIFKSSPYGETGYVRLTLSELFEDRENDTLRFISVESTKTSIVEALLVEEEDGQIVLHLVCKFRGEADIIIAVEDAKNVYSNYKIKYINEDLDDRPWLYGFFSDIVDDPSGLIAFLIIAIVLIAGITIFVARRKKKKMLMYEIERQLINEMELEEQLLKLSAAAPNVFDALPDGLEKFTEIGSAQVQNVQIGDLNAQGQIGQGEQLYLDSGEEYGGDMLQLDVGSSDTDSGEPQ